MKLSEFIKLLNSMTRNGDDPEIQFESYEWTDDLEYCEYLPRKFEVVRRRKGKIIVTTSR